MTKAIEYSVMTERQGERRDDDSRRPRAQHSSAVAAAGEKRVGATAAVLPNGDPPSLMLWGAEE